MKELTKQWNWPETRVFRFEYTDFQPEASRTATISLVWLQKRTAIIYAQIKNSISFTGGGVTSADCFFGEPITFTPLANLPASIIEYDVFLPVADNAGIGKAIPERTLPAPPGNPSIILNHDNATEMFLTLQVNFGSNINDLAAGEATIWFTYIRNR